VGVVKNEKGMGLIEVLISIAILGIITAAFFTVLSTASKSRGDRRTAGEGRNLAQDQMEYVMGQKLQYLSQRVK